MPKPSRTRTSTQKAGTVRVFQANDSEFVHHTEFLGAVRLGNDVYDLPAERVLGLSAFLAEQRGKRLLDRR